MRLKPPSNAAALFVPEVGEAVKLGRLLDDWDSTRQIMFCDETLAGEVASLPTTAEASGPWAILIGPEGGFSEGERNRLHRLAQSHPVTLGPRILRADTAAVAAMTVWQQSFGDWQ